MGNSLQDQLKKSGLVSKEKAKQVEAKKRKQERMQRKQGVEIVDENKVAAAQAREQQVEKDRQLNLQKKQEAEQKAIAAQVKQLIELNRQPRDEEGEAFNFTDNNKVKAVYVSAAIREHISDGKLAIVALGEGYEVVAAEVVQKIQARSPGSVIVMNDRNNSVSDDDPYADFQIPDDLTW